MHAEYIVNQAQRLVEAYGGRDPYDAVRQSGAIIKFKDLGTLKGAYFGNMDIPAIVINNSLDENIQKTVCAHELGHHILHKNQMLSCDIIDLQNASILEREANIFAAAFLIDTKKAISHLIEGETISQTAAELETDEQLLMFLLNSLKLTQAPDSTFLK